MAAELPRPGVEVIQEFRTVTPTIITPTLVPNVVGVGKQIVDLLVDSGAGSSVLNSDALIVLPGAFVASAAVGSPAVYGGLDGLELVLAFNNGPDITVLFSDPIAAGLTPASVVAQIQAAFTAAGVTAGRASLIGDGLTQFQVRTIGVGPFQFIDVKFGTSAAVASAFGIGIGRRYQGLNSYDQLITEVLQLSFPDPRGNLSELEIDNDSVRAFVGTGHGGFRESLRDSAFLRNGVVDDPAVTTEGTTDLVGAFPVIVAHTLNIKVNGGATQPFIASSPANAAALIAQLTAQLTGVTFSLGTGTPNGLVITSVLTGAGASVQIISGTLIALIGLTVETVVGFNIAAIDDGNGDQFTSLLQFQNENFTATPTAAVVTGNIDITGLTYPGDLAGKTVAINGGDQTQTVEFSATIANAAAVLSELNAVLTPAAGGKLTASLFGGTDLRFTHVKLGTDSVINIVGGTALTTLGLLVGTTRGVPSKPKPGDELWIDGVLLGTVSKVAPGGNVNVLQVAAQQVISLDVGSNFYITAKNLPDTAPRPVPDLVVDLNGTVSLKQEQLRDTAGNRVATTGPLYIAYTAVRKDVTALAANPGLLKFDNTTQLEQALAPINAENPLALGLFFALLNAPGIQVTGLGVDAVSADSPFGTVEAFTRAAEFLEGFEVYAIAPLTHDATVHQLFNTHVTAMSAPGAKGERVALVNPSLPTHKLDTLVASGTDGNTVGPGGLVFDTGIASLTALIQAAGINPVGTIPASAGLFLDIASDTKQYSIESVAGSHVTIRVTFSPGDNDDSFYSTTDLDDSPLPTALIEEAFSVKVRGASLVTVTGPDKNGIADTIAAVGKSYGNRRLWMTVPDSCAATVSGSEALIDGFYMNAALAGMVGQNPPQQSFTNFPIAGFTRVIGSNDTFNERQLNVMAGGGAWVIIQEAAGAALLSRMALTTDLTSVETRTDSITKVVDFTAKFLRRSLRNFIGRFNITQGFLDTLGSVIQGVCGLLVETGVLIGFNLNNIIQDENAPDTVLIDVTLDVPFPCNYIRLTLVI